MRVGLVTCLQLPEPDPDEVALVAELRLRGHEPVPVAWDGAEQPEGIEVYVLRSAWNYYHRPFDFLDWVEQTAGVASLVNPPEVVRWNIHKRYLTELARDGVSVVPTRLFSRGSGVDLKRVIGEAGWSRIVIKPAISAASYRTHAFHATELDAAQHFANELLSGGDILVQEYLSGYAEPGERSLIWIGGEWTHAVRKKPRFAGESETVLADSPPSPCEIQVGDAAIAPMRGRLSYGRVDLVRAGGQPLVSEVELMEPSLFFAYGPGSAAKFARVIEAAVR